MLVLLVLVFLTTVYAGSIPGCPPIDELDESSVPNLDDLLLCFCKIRDDDEDGVDISCLYGSNLDHLNKAAGFVSNASKIVKSVAMTHVALTAIADDQFAAIPDLKELTIADCVNPEPLAVSEHAFRGLPNLTTLRINSCDLKELKYLDLSSNFLSSVPEGTFAGLESLETLVIGEHNYMNESLLNEISKLNQLTELDLSRADGIFEFPKELSSLTNLKTLKLSGCSLTTLEDNEFKGLHELEMLDLRVNLIENATGKVFESNPQLQRISLAGNFIRNLDRDVWKGLDSLEDLDLGSNELVTLPADVFAPISRTLRILRLAHNLKLSEIAFGDTLPSLQTLDLSETNVTFLDEITLSSTPALTDLDLSRSNLSRISDSAFEPVKNSLKRLILPETKLSSLPENLLGSLPQLEVLDISNNKLICDTSLGKVTSSLNSLFKQRAEEGKDLELVNANDTVCDRPYSLRGSQVFDLPQEAFKDVDLATDTTTSKATTEGPHETTTEEEEITSTFVLPDILVGTDTNDTLVFPDEPRDRYDISQLDGSPKNEEEGSSNRTTFISLGVVALISVIVIAAVAVYIRNKRKGAVQPEKNAKKEDDGMVEIELGNSLKRNQAPPNQTTT